TYFKVRFLLTKPYLDFFAFGGLSDVSVACLRFFSCGLAGADVGAGCADVTRVETAGLGDFSLCNLCTELEISKNRLFIRQVEQRVGSWVEPMPPLKVMDNQLGELDAWDHNQSGLFSLMYAETDFVCLQ
nr:hypothetical protein [Tanacetum cinerariifolium]